MSQNNAKGGGPPTGAASGDLSGLYPSPIVVNIQQNPVNNTVLGAAQDGYALIWVNGSTEYQAKPVVAAGSAAGGDLSGTYVNPTVAKINGTTVSTAGGSLTTGKVLRVTGASTADWGAVDLANSSAVTGILPTGNQASQTMAGDVTGTTAASTVTKLQGNNVSNAVLGATQDGYVLTWSNADGKWEALPGGGGGSSVTWANDLASSSVTHQYVSGISGSSGTAGTVTLGDSSHNLSLSQVTSTTTTAPTLTVQASTGLVGSTSDGYAANTFSIIGGTGGAGSGTNKNGGAGGNLVISSGAGGAATGSGTAGSSGNLSLQLGSTELINISGSTVGNITITNTTAVPNIAQTAQSSTSGASGANGKDFTITAQAGQAATGASHNGGNGGNLVLAAGAGGTSGSATAGSNGYIKINSATVLKTTTQTTNYTVTYSDHHVFCNFSAGHNITLPAPVDGLTFEIWDIAGTAETNNITLVRNGSEKISGVAASRVLSTNWGHWTLTSNGTDWFLG